jgi:hypothetical protein
MNHGLRLGSIILIPIISCVAICGCTMVYRFDVSGVVKDEDGKPIDGVSIYSLKGVSSESSAEGRSSIAVTKNDGTFSFVEELDYGTRDSSTNAFKWVLLAAKDGFEDARFSLANVKPPESNNNPSKVHADFSLTPKPKAGPRDVKDEHRKPDF